MPFLHIKPVRLSEVPDIDREPFDPEGSGYDYATALRYGIEPDEIGHWPSREPTTGLLLKGRKHETWHKTIEGENATGHEIYRASDGRYYSQQITPVRWSSIPDQAGADPDAFDAPAFRQRKPDAVGLKGELAWQFTGQHLASKVPIAGGLFGAAEELSNLAAANRLMNNWDYSTPIGQKDIVSMKMNSLRPWEIDEELKADPSFVNVYANREEDIKRVEHLWEEMDRQKRGHTFGGKVTQIASHVPTWMLEFAATGGIAQMGSVPAKAAAGRVLGDYAKTWGGQQAMRAAGWSAGAITRASLGLFPRIAEEAVSRQVMGEIGARPEEGWATSIAKAWGTMAIESASEEAGGAITGGLGAIAKRLPFGSKLVGAIQKGWMKATGGTANDFIRKAGTLAGWNGIIGEFGEERLATAMHGLFNTEDFGAGKDAGPLERAAAGLRQDFQLQNVAAELAVFGGIEAGGIGARRVFAARSVESTGSMPAVPSTASTTGPIVQEVATEQEVAEEKPAAKAGEAEAIDRAATRIKATGKVFVGEMHGDTDIAAIASITGETEQQASARIGTRLSPIDFQEYGLEHGFVTSTGRFVSRIEAARIAKVHGRGGLDSLDIPPPAEQPLAPAVKERATAQELDDEYNRIQTELDANLDRLEASGLTEEQADEHESTKALYKQRWAVEDRMRNVLRGDLAAAMQKAGLDDPDIQESVMHQFFKMDMPTYILYRDLNDRLSEKNYTASRKKLADLLHRLYSEKQGVDPDTVLNPGISALTEAGIRARVKKYGDMADSILSTLIGERTEPGAVEAAPPAEPTAKEPWADEAIAKLKGQTDVAGGQFGKAPRQAPKVLTTPAVEVQTPPPVAQAATIEPGPVETAPPAQATPQATVDVPSQVQPGQNTPLTETEAPVPFRTMQDVILAAAEGKTRNTALTDQEAVAMDSFFATRDLNEFLNKDDVGKIQQNILAGMNELAAQVKAGQSFGEVWDQIIGTKERGQYRKRNDKGAQWVSRALLWEIDRRNNPDSHAEFTSQITDETDRRTAELARTMPAQLRMIASYIAEQNYEWGKEFADAGMIQEAKQNYAARILDVGRAETSVGGRAGIFSTFTGRTMARKFGSLAEASVHGCRLAVEDVSQAALLARSQMIRAMANRQLVDNLERLGLGGTTRQEGWTHVPGMTKWKYVEAKPEKAHYAEPDFHVTDTRESLPNEFEKGDLVYVEQEGAEGYVDKVTDGGDVFVYWPKEQGGSFMGTYPLAEIRHARGLPRRLTPDSKLLHKAPFYVTPGIAKRIRVVIEPSRIRQNVFGRKLLRAETEAKQSIFTYSLYHPLAYLRSANLAGRSQSPSKVWHLGKEAIVSTDLIVQIGVKNGLTVDVSPDVTIGSDDLTDTKTFFGRMISMTKPGEAAWNAILDAREKHNRFVFRKIGPYMKVGTYILEMRRLMEKHNDQLLAGTKSLDSLAHDAADYANNDFGGLHYERLGISRTVRDIFRMFFISPDWSISNGIMAVKAFFAGDVGAIHRAAWGRVFFTAGFITIVWNLIMSAFDEDDFVERYQKAWKTGNLRWLDVDVTPIYRALGGSSDARKYVSIIGHFRDPIKFAAHPLQTMKHKGSVLTRFTMDAMSGRDWRGYQFTTWAELMGLSDEGKYKAALTRYGEDRPQPVRWSQIPAFLAYEARSITPIPVNQLIAGLTGELDAFDVITKSAGLMTASARQPQEPRQKGLRLRKPSFGKTPLKRKRMFGR